MPFLWSSLASPGGSLAPSAAAEAEATVAFQRVGEAYGVLSDPEQRRLYDQKLAELRSQRQRCKEAALHRKQMAEFERGVRAERPSCSAQVREPPPDSRAQVITLKMYRIFLPAHTLAPRPRSGRNSSPPSIATRTWRLMLSPRPS